RYWAPPTAPPPNYRTAGSISAPSSTGARNDPAAAGTQPRQYPSPRRTALADGRVGRAVGADQPGQRAGGPGGRHGDHGGAAAAPDPGTRPAANMAAAETAGRERLLRDRIESPARLVRATTRTGARIGCAGGAVRVPLGFRDG